MARSDTVFVGWVERSDTHLVVPDGAVPAARFFARSDTVFVGWVERSDTHLVVPDGTVPAAQFVARSDTVFVGWVERSDTHLVVPDGAGPAARFFTSASHVQLFPNWQMGVASLDPSYLDPSCGCCNSMRSNIADSVPILIKQPAAPMRESEYEIEELQRVPRIGGGSVFDSIEYTEPAKRLTATVAELYRETLDRRGFAADDAQYAAVLRLQRVYEEWMAYKYKRSSALRRLVVRPPLPRGVYLWGGVGRGKSFLLDSFYLTLPLVRKRRVHFHHFMRDVHREMDTLRGTADPLEAVAERIATRYRLICFDEFHVNDIADAMILGRLLQKTMDRGVVYCMTSNYHPDELYLNGLKRENFLPTIALIKERLDVVNVDSGIDYRLRSLEQVQVYHTPPGPAADAALMATFRRIADVEEEHHELDVEGRVIPYRHRAGGVVWFDFEGAVRPWPFATGLPGSGQAFPLGHRVRRPAFRRLQSGRIAPLHAAGRRVL